MSSPRQATAAIKDVMSSPRDCPREELAELAVTYAEYCRQANDRLRACAEYLRRGLLAEAIYHAEVKPDVLDLVCDLDLPRAEEWQLYCQQNQLEMPPGLSYDVAKDVNEAYNTQLTLASLLKKHRVLALAKAPLKTRLKVLRALAERDPHNPIWEEDLGTYEKARLSEMAGEAKKAEKAGQLEELYSFLSELTEHKWRIPIPEVYVDAIRKGCRQVQVQRALAKLTEFLPDLDDAYIAASFEECATLADQWNEVVQNNRLTVPDDMQAQVQPVFDWVMAQRAEREAAAAFALACGQLEQALDESAKTMSGLSRMYREVKAFDLPLPEALERRYHTEMSALVLAQRRKLRAILLWSTPVAVGIAVTVFVVIQRGIDRVRVEQYRAQIRGLIEEGELADAAELWATATQEYANRTELAEMKPQIDEATVREEDRRQRYEAKVAQLATALAGIEHLGEERDGGTHVGLEQATKENTAIANVVRLHAEAEELARTPSEKLKVRELQRLLTTIHDPWQKKIDQALLAEVATVGEELRRVDVERLLETDLDALAETVRDLGIQIGGLRGGWGELATRELVVSLLPPLEGQIKRIEKQIDDQREEEKKARDKQRRIAGLLESVEAPDELAAKLVQFAEDYPDAPEASAFRKAAENKDAWLAVRAWAELSQSWGDDFLCRGDDEIAKRQQALQDYDDKHPSSPVSPQRREDYREYLSRARQALADDGSWKGYLANVARGSVMMRLWYIKTKDGKCYYTRRGATCRRSGAAVSVEVVQTNDVTKTKRLSIKDPLFDQPKPSPQYELAKAIYNKVMGLSAANWDTFGLEILQLVRKHEEVDPVLRAQIVDLVAKEVKTVGWGLDEEMQQLQGALSMWDLSINWIDADDKEAAALRPETAEALQKHLEPIEELKKRVAERRRAMIAPLRLGAVGYGLALKEKGEWKVKVQGLLADGCRILAVTRGHGGAGPQLREIAKVEKEAVVIDEAMMRLVPEGSLVFVCQSTSE